MNSNQMQLRNAGFREHKAAQKMAEKIGVKYEDLLAHGVYDSSRDVIHMTVKAVTYTMIVNDLIQEKA